MLRIIRILFICILFCTTISSTFSLNSLRHFHIVTSFSILKDWIDILIKDIPKDVFVIETIGLVPVQSDPHVYQPTPKDVRNIACADLIIVLGLTFDGWIDRLINASETKATVLRVAHNVEARLMPAADPHVWHDVQKTRLMVQNLKEALCKMLPEAADTIQKNAMLYDIQLVELDKSIKEKVAALPMNRRKIITTHDAFHYYGAAYGFSFCAPVGLSTEAEADSKSVALLIKQIKDEKTTAIFFENLANRSIVKQIAEETGVVISEKNVLYADSLSEKTGSAANYIAMMQHNTNLIVNSLSVYVKNQPVYNSRKNRNTQLKTSQR
ncbi:MAG: zinc ABC transporter substrate-binding protein [Candidatus Paracaedibacteraceae bacterium]|nr:zinc ABC transporter substrate-binding protein [Candidatus Paracaedibacteraceae bacterium]